MNRTNIRIGTPADLAALESLYPATFPDEDLLPLVRDLIPDPKNVLSLVAVRDAEIVGHVAFSKCGLEGTDTSLALLAPLAVSPAAQRTGIGSELVRAGLEALKMDGVVAVLVLGDPAYYCRFGFSVTSAILAPYELPEEYMNAWQLLGLSSVAAELSGKLIVPSQWRQPALWSA